MAEAPAPEPTTTAAAQTDAAAAAAAEEEDEDFGYLYDDIDDVYVVASPEETAQPSRTQAAAAAPAAPAAAKAEPHDEDDDEYNFYDELDDGSAAQADDGIIDMGTSSVAVGGMGIMYDAQSARSQLEARLAKIAQPEGYEAEVDGPGEKRWHDGKAQVADFFNYGFNEETWRRYCYKRETIRRNMPLYQEVEATSNCATPLGRLLLRATLRRDAPGCFDDVPDAVLDSIDIDPRLQQQCEQLLLAHRDLEPLGYAPHHKPRAHSPLPHRHPRYRRP